MKTERKINISMKKIIYTAIFLISLTASTQEIKNTKLTKQKLIKAAKEIINSTGTCALITQDQKGNSRVRTMDPFPPENDLTIWFGTNPKSRKVTQIKNNNKVTLYYRDKDDSGYVTINGIATLINKQELKNKYWKNSWKSFYPNKKESYLLIKVTPISMEIVSPPRNIIGSDSTWEPPTVYFNAKK